MTATEVLASAPVFAGKRTLAKGYYSGSALRSPLRNISAQMTFENENITLTQAHADIGSGGVDAEGSASTTLHDPAGLLTFVAHARAQNVTLDPCRHTSGNARRRRDPDAQAARPDRRLPGTSRLLTARIPLTALYQPQGKIVGKPASHCGRVRSRPWPPAGTCGFRAVRSTSVQPGKSTSAGSLAAPALAGRMVSTGGQHFVLPHVSVSSAPSSPSPSDGVVPTVDAGRDDDGASAQHRRDAQRHRPRNFS